MRRTEKGVPVLSWAMSIRNSDPILLENCLRSIRERTPQAEIVIVDNMSREEATLQVAKKYADVLHSYRGPQGNWTADDPWTTDMAASRQRAFELASGRWRGWIDDDDILPGPEEAERLLKLNERWKPPGNRVEEGPGRPVNLEDLLLEVEKKVPDADVICAPYLYAKDEHGQAYTWQERERIVKWSSPARWVWREAAHEIMVPVEGYTPKAKMVFAHLLFVHERKFSDKSHDFAVRRHFDVLERQYHEGDRTTRRSLYLAGYATILCPEREREFLDSAHELSTTPLDRYRSKSALGQMYARQGLYSDALEAFAAAVHLRPDLPDAWFQGAEVWVKNEDWMLAAQWLEKGMETAPGNFDSQVAPRHQFIRYPTLLSDIYEKIARAQIKCGLQDVAQSYLGRACELLMRVKDSPGAGFDKREAEIRLAKMHNAYLAQANAIQISRLAKYLLDNDESQKATGLLRIIPWNLRDHPLTVEMEKRLAPVQEHLSNPKAYTSFYTKDSETGYVESPEKWLTKEHCLDRVKWVAGWINTYCPKAIVLEVGCFDGIIGIPLLELCPEITYVGMDIYKKPAERFRQRIAQRNLGARAEIFREDSIDQIPTLKADVILWFEVIEHVPDPVSELYSIKRHLKPGGQIFVTTPWGSFDAGHPPAKTDHGTPRDSRSHVRAMNARDIADVMDRSDLEIEELYRSPVADGFLGDGLHVQATNRLRSPKPPAIFVVPGALWDWNSRTVHGEGMGASEKSIVLVSEALATQYRRVEVYGPVPEENAFRGVRYWPTSQLRHLRKRKIIVSRGPGFGKYLDDQVLPDPLSKILWLQDAWYPDLTKEVALGYEKIVVVSKWHKKAMHERHGVPLEKMEVIYNPIDDRLYRTPNRPARKPDHFIYCSSPDRGLIPLLELWDEIRGRLPTATLDIFYGFRGCEKLGGGTDAHWTKRYESCRRAFEKLRHQPGIRVRNMVSPAELAQEFLRAGVWAYPVIDFHETCCTAALEARAAGCVPVAPPLAALAETALCYQGFMTPLATDPFWKDEFVKAVVKATLVSVQDREAMAEEALELYGLDPVLAQWERLLE